MKRCRTYRKLIVWLASGDLDENKRRSLDAHLVDCRACRSYWKEINGLAGLLAAGESDSSLTASPAFHQNLLNVIKAEKPRPVTMIPSSWRNVFRLGWMPAAAAAIALLLLTAWNTSWKTERLTPPDADSTSRIDANNATPAEPTLVNYQMAVRTSLDQLNELLNRQADKSPPGAPVYTASGGTHVALAD